MADLVTKEVQKALATYLLTAIPELEDVVDGFPEANINLKYPSISIATMPSVYTPLNPYIFSQPAAVSHQSNVKYVVGQYNWKLQLDLWESYKEKRHALHEKFMAAFHNNIPNTSGLVLTLSNYHGILCSYTMVRYAPDNSEAGSQRKEWRATIDLEANCKAVLTKQQYIITQEPELTLETPNNIEP